MQGAVDAIRVLMSRSKVVLKLVLNQYVAQNGE
jgi:hypothetical protein